MGPQCFFISIKNTSINKDIQLNMEDMQIGIMHFQFFYNTKMNK